MDIPAKLRRVRPHTWILFALIVLGIFFRAYHFQSLLVFASDQARDLRIVDGVVNGKAPWPLLGPDMTGGRGFRLGAIYYYFQIVSAELFGVGAPQQAFPDLLFSVLSIPLLYHFLRRYFDENAALLSTAAYVFSYFSIEYSRFAWNVNLIPFFLMLYLSAVSEFLARERETSWKWTAGLGIAVGVGVQLHAILLLLLPAMTALVFLFVLARGRVSWRKFAAVVGIALCLNLGQLISEQRTGFANTRTFLSAFLFKSERTGGSFTKGLKLDVACNAQANLHILSSLGNKDICDILYAGDVTSPTYATPIAIGTDPLSIAGKIAVVALWLSGWGLLSYRFSVAAGRERRGWALLILYGVSYFLVMMPIAPGSRMRYYLPIIVMPFVFLSLAFDFLAKRIPKRWYVRTVGMIMLFLFLMNMNSIRLKLENPGCDKAIRNDFGCNMPLMRGGKSNPTAQ